MAPHPAIPLGATLRVAAVHEHAAVEDAMHVAVGAVEVRGTDIFFFVFFFKNLENLFFSRIENLFCFGAKRRAISHADHRVLVSHRRLDALLARMALWLRPIASGVASAPRAESHALVGNLEFLGHDGRLADCLLAVQVRAAAGDPDAVRREVEVVLARELVASTRLAVHELIASTHVLARLRVAAGTGAEGRVGGVALRRRRDAHEAARARVRVRWE